MEETHIDETRYGYVYRIVNLLNDKTYIGQHKVFAKEKWLAYMGSGRLVRYAVHKHGVENFDKQLLSYADSKEELDILEKSFIEEELLNGRAEYNINGSDAKLAIRLDELDLNDEDLLRWYFDENMSYNDIALKLNCSIPTIYGYMKTLRDKDKRFENVKQGDSRGKSIFSEESRKKAQEKINVRVACDNCLIEISYANYSKHFKACSDKNNFRKHKCAEKECQKMIYLRNTYCQKHFSQNSNFSADDLKKGGIVASHNRWHVKRGKVSEDCELCQKDLLK